jgi:hypothetical protein
MASKVDILKKRLIRDGIISAVLLILLAGGGYEVSDYDDQTTADKQKADADNGRLTGENSTMQLLLNSGAEVNAFYDAYSKEHKTSLAIDRETMTKTLTELREKNHLTNLSLTVSPITTPSQDKTMGLKTGNLLQSEVKLSFNALTDNSVFGFIEALERQLPGIVMLHDIKITKSRDLGADVLRDLNIHRLDTMVTAEVAFTWIGLHTSEEKANAAPDMLHPPLMPRAPNVP